MECGGRDGGTGWATSDHHRHPRREYLRIWLRSIGSLHGSICCGDDRCRRWYPGECRPGQFNFDATLQKTTKVGGLREDATLVFRTELFNMFNHAQFNNPTGTGAQLDVSKSTFGQITSTSVNPRLIQFALKYVF